jgi:hypothetical protein
MVSFSDLFIAQGSAEIGFEMVPRGPEPGILGAVLRGHHRNDLNWPSRCLEPGILVAMPRDQQKKDLKCPHMDLSPKFLSRCSGVSRNRI